MTSPRGTESRAIAEWLAKAHPLPDQARGEWARQGVALLPLGRRFDAVRVPAERVHAAVGSDKPTTVTVALADWLHGPVIRDTRGCDRPYYVLVDPAADWGGAEERLSTDSYLGVPRVGPLTVAAAWVVLPQYPGELCATARLRALLSLADWRVAP
ncbi:hypothetical protein [Streptomyces flavofungini]|uniref:DNA primase/polymerase bifunctional N-terminal domain-containing protein n=1 Tax=Streptomyces flavofungini TaxID=68200 RepID=A0ABS0WXY6_9ACTN|nr:hypothetical protein [Streptomyces flavofungini]MBJ3805797.1 hypothetical protein [Streptomyces flavofungini]GHC71691.1 hypothetical protein GCM10010349_48070 [Streptomyces flavofungini]